MGHTCMTSKVDGVRGSKTAARKHQVQVVQNQYGGRWMLWKSYQHRPPLLSPAKQRRLLNGLMDRYAPCVRRACAARALPPTPPGLTTSCTMHATQLAVPLRLLLYVREGAMAALLSPWLKQSQHYVIAFVRASQGPHMPTYFLLPTLSDSLGENLIL